MSDVDVERIKDRIHIWFGYSPILVAAMRTIPGRNFVKTPSRHWTAPLNMQTCRDLRAAFGDRLHIGPELTAWAREQISQEVTGAALGTVSLGAFAETVLSTVPSRAPELFNRLLGRGYQVPVAAFIASRDSSLIGDQPGLGKTTEIMAGLVERFGSENADIIITAPKTSLETVWGPETREWMPGAEIFVAPEGRAARLAVLAAFDARRAAKARPQFLILCVNAEMVRTRVEKYAEPPFPEDGTDEEQERWQQDDDEGLIKHKFRYLHEYPELFAYKWDAQIVDEGHKYLISNYSQVWNPRMSQTRRGLAMLPLAKNGLRIASSGTPFRGKIQNFWGTLNWLYPKNYTSFWTWADSYLDVSDGYGTSKIVGDLRQDREADLYRSLSTIMIRRTKPELRNLNPAWAPPDKQYVSVRCVMEKKQRGHYNQMADNAALQIGDGSLTANGVLAEITRLRQLAHASGSFDDNGAFHPALPSAKFSQVVQMLSERGITGKAEDDGEGVKIVIGGQFTQMLNLYSKELKRMGIDHFLLTGATPMKERAAQVKRFQSAGGPRIFIINTAAGGTTLTLDAADELWVLDETWVPDEQEQLEDRVHRTSNTEHQVTIYYFITLDTVEEDIAVVTAERDETQKVHLDQRRGVEFAKRWVESKHG